MIVLVSNVGSSSYKFRVIDMSREQTLARGGVDRIGDPPSAYAYGTGESASSSGEMDAPDHLAAIEHALAFLSDNREGDAIVPGLDKLGGIGFKTVFATGLTSSALIDDHVVRGLEDRIPLVPVHNPAYIASIRAFQRLAPTVPLVAVFETWFHETLPDYAREFGVPRSWVEEHDVRRYGFHGASHRYVAQRVPIVLDRLGLTRGSADELRIVSCHLGGSSSLCAVRGGVSIDTSMGLSAQSGVLQGTRCGDLDPFALLYMLDRGGLSVEEAQRSLMRDAGLAGISGVGSDMREILAAARQGNSRAQLALDTFHYGVKKMVGSYAAALGGIDVLAFTGGIGEKGPENRAAICEGLGFLGAELDPAKNQAHDGEGDVSRDGSPTPILVIPANEEIIVARETERVISSTVECTRR